MMEELDRPVFGDTILMEEPDTDRFACKRRDRDLE